MSDLPENKSNKELSLKKRRRYTRMDTTLPVEILLPETKKQHARFLQGFTQNISEGGMRLEVKRSHQEAQSFLAKGMKLDLLINVPYMTRPIEAEGKVVWYQEIRAYHMKVDVIGIEYARISPRDAKGIVRFARARWFFPRATIATIIILALLSASLFVHQRMLVQNNQALVTELVALANKKEAVLAQADRLGAEARQLQKKLDQNQLELDATQKALGQVSHMNEKIVRQFEDKLKVLMQEKSDLVIKQKALKEEGFGKNIATEEILEDVGEGDPVTRELSDWLLRHQTRKTGLLPSYEGDEALDNISFTYDQALAAIVFSIIGEDEAARKIMSFFAYNAERLNGIFVSAYHTALGQPMEWNVHVGPNVWVGLAALQYEKLTGDSQYRDLAILIADWIVDFQKTSPDNGLRGGPNDDWFSTEHNLDAYAFLIMLDQISGEKAYVDPAEKLLNWIFEHATDRTNNRFKRGKGDGTIATDTFSWGIAAIGPEILDKNGLDPEGIMEFAEEHCRVSVSYDRPDNNAVNITGFDFAKHEHLARGGIVSSEWTAQAVVTYKILRDYYASLKDFEKAQYHSNKASFYLNELQKMMISSLSRTGQGKGCLPYATQPNAPTGHGWRTPNGDKTGSVAGTAYTILGRLGFNPFQLENT